MLYFSLLEVPSLTSAGRRHYVVCYFTFWCFFLLNCHLVTAALVTLFHFCKTWKNQRSTPRNTILFSRKFHQEEIDGEVNTQMLPREENQNNQGRPKQDNITWYMKISWVLFTISTVSAPVVTIMYFAAISPRLNRSIPFPGDIHAHAINSVIVLIEVLFSAIPIRILHSVYAIIFGLFYILFSVIYWAVDHRNVLYHVLLDWNKPKNAVLITLGISILAIFVTFILFLLYKLRLYIFMKCNKASQNMLTDENGGHEIENNIIT